MLSTLQRFMKGLRLQWWKFRYRPGKIISGLIARDVERQILVVSADEIDAGYLTVQMRTNNLLYLSVEAVKEEPFDPPQRIAIDEIWRWSGDSWGGRPDGPSITDREDFV